jgi:ubiquinone/menaquinone biosynthesis C-methylase UbiE
MLEVAADAVAAVTPRLVCDLGKGTGALSAALLMRPEIQAVELIDVDSEMLAQARQRLMRFADRVSFTLGSYDEPLSSCDAFVASLSLHHIATIELKSALFTRVYDKLRPGGVLVNADVNMPIDRVEQERLYRYWADHLVDNGIAEDRAWQYFAEWSEADTYLSTEAELGELCRIGFAAEYIWRDGPVGVMVAKKI